MPVSVPPGAVTSRVVAPTAVEDGAVTVSVVLVGEPTMVAGLPPIVTAVTPLRLVPVTVIVLPPASGPWVGLTPVTAGAGAT